jgi:6-pyruvoyltetrahydropterin/6-carboxytetrahydropterin synthase
MYEVSTVTHFSAAHHLRGYAGACASPHGHNWEVEVLVRGSKLDRTGILVDFRRLKQAVQTVFAEIDHCDLNVLSPFKTKNPTSENIACYLLKRLSAALDCARYRVWRVTVCETPGNRASCWRDGKRKRHD